MFDQRNEGQGEEEGKSLKKKGLQVTKQVNRYSSKVGIQENTSISVIEESGFDQSKYEKRAVQISVTKFVLKHINDSAKDIAITMIDDEEDKKIVWEGMPLSLQHEMEQDYELVKGYSLMKINQALAALTEDSQGGLRPFDEYR